jgi:hypothetical protein
MAFFFKIIEILIFRLRKYFKLIKIFHNLKLRDLPSVNTMHRKMFNEPSKPTLIIRQFEDLQDLQSKFE